MFSQTCSESYSPIYHNIYTQIPLNSCLGMYVLYSHMPICAENTLVKTKFNAT